MIRCSVVVSALVMSVELASTCICAAGTFTAPAEHVCSSNEASNSARNITCAGTGAERRVCMLATRDAPLCEVGVAALVKSCLALNVA